MESIVIVGMSILGRLLIPMMIPLLFGVFNYRRTRDRRQAVKAGLSLLPLALAFMCLAASLLGNVMSAAG